MVSQKIENCFTEIDLHHFLLNAYLCQTTKLKLTYLYLINVKRPSTFMNRIRKIKNNNNMTKKKQ